jgi:predicted nucleic acid-binding Zn ribbon protein
MARSWYLRVSDDDGRGASFVQSGLMRLLSVPTLGPLVKEQLQQLERVPSAENAETARLFGFVADVLLAQEPVRERARLGPTARRNKALAVVPPELRQTVDELATRIIGLRKRGGSRKTVRPRER